MQMLGGPILLDLTRGSQRRKLTLSAHLNSSEARSKSKSNFSCSSYTTSPQVPIEPWTGLCKLKVIWSRHRPKWSVKWVQVQVRREHPGSLLTPSKRNLDYASPFT